MNASDVVCMEEAFRLAKKSFDEGDLPIGSVLAEGAHMLGRGHNRRVQLGDPILAWRDGLPARSPDEGVHCETTLYDDALLDSSTSMRPRLVDCGNARMDRCSVTRTDLRISVEVVGREQ